MSRKYGILIVAVLVIIIMAVISKVHFFKESREKTEKTHDNIATVTIKGNTKKNSSKSFSEPFSQKTVADSNSNLHIEDATLDKMLEELPYPIEDVLEKIGHPDDGSLFIWQHYKTPYDLSENSLEAFVEKTPIEGERLLTVEQLKALKEEIIDSIGLIGLNDPNEYLASAQRRGEHIPDEKQKEMLEYIMTTNYAPANPDDINGKEFQIIWSREIPEPFWVEISDSGNVIRVFSISCSPEDLKTRLMEIDQQHVFNLASEQGGYRRCYRCAIPEQTQEQMLEKYNKLIYADITFLVRTNKSNEELVIPQLLRLWWDPEKKAWHPSELTSPSGLAVGPLIF